MIARYALTTLALAACALACAQTTLYVSPTGDDAWSGTLPEANAAGDDGPLASLIGARDAIRSLRVDGALPGPLTVQLRGGAYYLTETLALGPEDSGTKDAPITWTAYPGETPELVGGPRIDGPWIADEAGVLSTTIDDPWLFRQLFVDGERQIRARFPNYDPENPYRGGFAYVARGIGGFGGTVGRIHNKGDRMDWDVVVPADGDYHVWVLYGHNMTAFDCPDMGGRTVLIVDGGEPVPLMNLPDTGGWGADTWNRSATLSLTAGEHRIRWENQVGGGLDLDAFALCTDDDWTPVGYDLADPAAGEHLFIIQAEDFVDFQGPQLYAMGGDKNRFYSDPGQIDPAWVNAPGAELHIFPSGRTSCRAFKEILTLEALDERTGVVTVGGAECRSNLRKGDRYFVENARVLLDAPGEWYLDPDTGLLSIIPPEGFADTSEVVAPALERIIEVIATEDAPVSHLRFEGLAFRCTDYSPEDTNAGYGMGSDGVIRLEGATDCAVSGSTFTALGKYAVCASGGGGHSVTGNSIGYSASGGVLLLDSAGNEISGNHIHDCGLVYKHIGGVAMQGSETSDNLVSRNTIQNMSRYGITMKNAGVSNVIEFNHVARTNTETYDTGAIEVTQGGGVRGQLSGSVIRNNIVADSVGYSSEFEEPRYCGWGIYLDSYASGYTVENNICYRSSHGGIMFQGGHGNVVVNNIFVEGRDRQATLSNFQNGFADNVLERNIFYYTDPASFLISGGVLSPDIITVDNNLYWCPGMDEPAIRARDISTWEQWLALGFDANSIFQDPLFVDPDNDDYALQPGSPAFGLGFKPIDVSHVGAD